MEPIKYESWKIREAFEPDFQLTPIAKVVLRERILNVIDKLKKDLFEDFAFKMVREREGRLAEIQQRGEYMESEGFDRILRLRSDENVLFRPSSKTFPFIDFALCTTIWFQVKSVDPSLDTVSISHKGAKAFLEKNWR